MPRLAIRPGVRFGEPLDFSRYYGLEDDHIVLRAMTDEIMYELMKLSGQEYVDEYAQRAKLRLSNPLHHDGRGKPGPEPEEPQEPEEDQAAASSMAVRATAAAERPAADAADDPGG